MNVRWSLVLPAKGDSRLYCTEVLLIDFRTPSVADFVAGDSGCGLHAVYAEMSSVYFV